MDSQDIQGIIRHLLTTAGGALVTQGLLTQGQVSDLVGAVMVIGGIAWSLYQKAQTRKLLAKPQPNTAAVTRALYAAVALGFALEVLSACSATSGSAPGAVTIGLEPSIASSLQKVQNFTLADLQAADADAVANNDAIAHACYPALEKFVQSMPSPSGTVAGAFSTFQKARDLGAEAQAGIPTYLTIGCAPLVVDTQTLLAKLAGIGVGAAATAGAVLPVPIAVP